MVSYSSILAFGLAATCHLATAIESSVRLEVKAALNSRSANIHLSQSHPSVFPYTVTYGPCHSLSTQAEADHHVALVRDDSTDRLVWVLPDDISSNGCLSAWSSSSEPVGRSEPLKIKKDSKHWMRKRHLDRGTKMSKRASIPMTNASGIEANGPWFDGVEALKESEISTVDAAQAKAKRRSC